MKRARVKLVGMGTRPASHFPTRVANESIADYIKRYFTMHKTSSKCDYININGAFIVNA